MPSSLVFAATIAPYCGGETHVQKAPVKQEFGRNSALVGIGVPPSAAARTTFVNSRRAAKSAFHVFCSADASVLSKEFADEDTSPFTPNASQVQSLLEVVCDETRIAEFKMKVGDFELRLKRDIGKAKGVAAPLLPLPVQPIVAGPPAAAAVAPVASSATPLKSSNSSSSILPATISKTASLFGLLDAAADHGLSFVTSPKVGLFRRGRTLKGKRGKALVEEGFTIKEGQVVGYLEQLGTQQPVEAQVAGEVVQVLWEDGESVGYGDPLISIRPSFQGIVPRPALN